MSLFPKDIKSFSDEVLMQMLSTRRCNEALTELHARYGKKVLGFFIRMFQGDGDKAQDFVQELFIRIMEKHHQFNPEKKFYTWMFTIASNMCKTNFRKPNHQSLSVDNYQLNNSAHLNENCFDKVVFRKALKKAVANLEQHHRLTFVLRYMEELSIKEISEITETSEGTVKSRLFYATKKVAKCLEEFNPVNDGTLFKMN
ncbi:MAG: sigma-70 family RNA polymerase sigma factor [Crocinitomicaceae bacterium]|nr:sigma-70 family RNA polymerase sigma factor [Crocinitomicaceae bacterium]